VPVRRLTPRDTHDYRALMLEAYERHPDAFTSTRRERERLPLSFWEARLARGRLVEELVFGHFLGDELMGAVGLRFAASERLRHKATLFGMFVRPDARGQGVGRVLIRKALRYAKSRSPVSVVQLTVSEGNGAAQLLYERSGFTTFGREPRAVSIEGRYVTKVHMWRGLERDGSTSGALDDP
jgi:ribosomal protein S18 acetylase RimI-like enzyme